MKKTLPIGVILLIVLSMFQGLPMTMGFMETWYSTTPLPHLSCQHGTVVHNDRIYVVGGQTPIWGIRYDTVLYGSVQPDGTIDTWLSTTKLPEERESPGAQVYENWIYVLGGSANQPDGVIHRVTVWFASFNPDGTIGDWTSTTSLPYLVGDTAYAEWNGRIYLLGGLFHDDVHYAEINPDGSLGNWKRTTSLPEPRVYHHEAVVHNGVIYLVGGEYPSNNFPREVYYATIDASGEVGAWTETTPLPVGMEGHFVLVYGDDMFVIGGSMQLIHYDTVYKAHINPDGSLDSWIEWGRLPEPRARHSSIVLDGRVYVIGGRFDPDSLVDTVYFANIEPMAPPFQSPAIWLYNFDQYDLDDLDVLVGNLDSMGFKTVWLSTDTAKLDEESYSGKVSSFIGKAKEEDKGIFVHAMILQDPNFTRTVNHEKALQDVDAVLSYNLENPGRAFDGIHIDVEPYGLDDWSKTDWENNNNLMAMYIELLSKIHRKLQGKSLMFSAAHPHWYQNRANELPDEFPNGQTSQFGEYLDVIVLMVYDGGWAHALDTAQEIVDEAEEEIEKADLAGNVDIVVGLGVQEFWKYSWLNDCMIEVDQELETNPSYKGLSVFNYKSFSEIKTWEYRIEDRRRHTVLMVNTTDKHFKFDNASTPEEEFSVKEATLMLRTRSNIIILHQDEEIKLIAWIKDSWQIGHCFATAEDSLTGKKYVLNDTYWLLGR